MKISCRALAGALLGCLLTIPCAVSAQPSSAQSSCPAPEARQFDFWIGEWSTDNSQRSPTRLEDPTWNATGSARSIIWPALGGCAIVELWRGELSWADLEGFSVRAWDPATEQWHLVLNWPSSMRALPLFSTLEGGFEHGRGEFFSERTRPEGTPVLVRFTFSDIGPERFRWDQAFSIDEGNLWRPSWIMRTSRVEEGEELGLEHFADASAEAVGEPLCAESEARELDGLVGAWTTDGGTLTVHSILRGCAQMATLETADGGGDRFWVRAFDPNEEKWVQYGLAEGEPVFERLEGGMRDGEWVVSGDGEESWSWNGDGLRISRGDGATWSFRPAPAAVEEGSNEPASR